MGDNKKIAILGASGYTGSELLRILCRHPKTEIALLSGDRSAGKNIADIFPQFHALLGGRSLPPLVSIEAIQPADWQGIDLVFCALPHGTTQHVVAGLPPHLRIIDLSADFRLRDAGQYQAVYGKPHQAIDAQKQAVFGLAEIYTDQIKTARLVANPGCYPTASSLPLIPLLQSGQELIKHASIIIDAKSGVSGAGRAAKESSLFAEVSEGLRAYGFEGEAANHRHAPEIDQILNDTINYQGEKDSRRIMVSFTPHLVPMNRGILSTVYVELANNTNLTDVRSRLTQFYAEKSFVKILPPGVVPATQMVRGSNYCFINVFADRRPGHAVIVSVIDNLVKGASGQAVQNMNFMLGLAEETGLADLPMFP
ncbi:MAG: N-acetyl-gamma-glutamyl-phosphate reductase [Candidatus Symbiobacter sp.]|nr:N-acetyl-gamma-glutamyl-phosphate reductase [Candidatus Symbiobacter sp.]